jgi:NitT/TauT family transport system ATP-binding protein
MTDPKDKSDQAPAPSPDEAAATPEGQPSEAAPAAEEGQSREPPKPDEQKPDASKPDSPKPEAPKPDEPKPDEPSAVTTQPAEEKPAEQPEDKPPVVVFRGVTKTFHPGTRHAYTAIKDVNFTVDDLPDIGEFVTVVGPSGCGKSTILRLIAGLTPHHPPSQGEVEVFGEPVEGPGADRGMVFQSYTSFDNRTVLDNVAFGLECRGLRKHERYERARHWIHRVGLSIRNDQYKYPHQLSGGMRQRVAIARTLILKPRIILMDEPFGALDPTTRLHMQDLLIGLWREVEATVFFVTHDITEAVYLGDRCFVLSSAPGTLLRELDVPRPDRPAAEMQREAKFQETVYELRDVIEQLEEGKD